MDVSVLRCAACGGTLPDGVGTCPFCKAAVAARHCLSCFHANLASAVHCAACGRELGLDPLPDVDSLQCPACGPGVRFQSMPAGERGVVRECPRCSGQFVDHATLRMLFEERLAMPLTGQRPTVPFAPGPVRYLPCPVCSARMNRKNFGDRSGVIVDVCKAHGIWFDRGELPRVLAFVEAGGLREAQAREEARKREIQREAARAVLSTSAIPESRWGERDLLTEIFRALIS